MCLAVWSRFGANLSFLNLGLVMNLVLICICAFLVIRLCNGFGADALVMDLAS